MRDFRDKGDLLVRDFLGNRLDRLDLFRRGVDGGNWDDNRFHQFRLNRLWQERHGEVVAGANRHIRGVVDGQVGHLQLFFRFPIVVILIILVIVLALLLISLDLISLSGHVDVVLLIVVLWNGAFSPDTFKSEEFPSHLKSEPSLEGIGQ